jgi:hypothetical protein
VKAEIAKLQQQTRGDTSGLLGVPILGSVINDLTGAGAQQAELARLQGILNGMNAINAQLGKSGQGQPPVYLLGFDTNNLGHAIVSYGNPDTAQNVVTYVPGLGSGLGTTAAGDLSRASRLYGQAKFYDPNVSTASIYWLGYNAPQLDLKVSSQSLSPPALIGDAQVALEGDAKAAAATLDSFAAGLSAAHDPAFAAHTVMLGHSYGSLAVAEAAIRATGKLANDVIFVGSPGVGVNNVSGLDISGQHVWAGHALWDEVPDLPPLGDPRLPIPTWLNLAAWPVTEPLGLLDPNASHFGTDPASGPFGARDFQVAPGPLWPLLKAHSDYWLPGSTSLQNMAHIVDGQYKQVQLVTPQSAIPSRSVPGTGMPGTPYP